MRGRPGPRAACPLTSCPQPLPPLVTVVGDEELLVTRAIAALSAAARRDDPEVTETERAGSRHRRPRAARAARPVAVRRQSAGGAPQRPGLSAWQRVGVLTGYLETPAEGTTLVLHHVGGAKGKAVLEAARAAGAGELACAKLTRPAERADFVRAEVRRAGGRIEPAAVTALLDAVGSDLRELAATAAQLVSDSGGTRRDRPRPRLPPGPRRGVRLRDRRPRRGRAMSPARSRPCATRSTSGVPHVVIADALADGVRTVARVASAGRASNEFHLANRLGMPPWKVKRALSQSRGWTEPGMRQALHAVAVLNADVKGEAADPAYALERAVLRLAAAKATAR